MTLFNQEGYRILISGRVLHASTKFPLAFFTSMNATRIFPRQPVSRKNSQFTGQTSDNQSHSLPYSFLGGLHSSSIHRPQHRTDRLTQRIRDMNISTSFIEDCGDDDSSPTDVKPCLPHSSIDCTSMPQFGKNESRRSCTPVDVRQSVLETIGILLDESQISCDEATTAITLAMQPDDISKRMDSLLKSRKTLEARGLFLRLWLRGRSAQGEQEPSPIIPVKQMRIEPVNDFPEFDRPLTRSNSVCRLELHPSSSPPLLPVSLNFAEESPTDSGPSMLPSHIRNPSVRTGLKMYHLKGGHSTPSTMSPSPELAQNGTFMRQGSQSSDEYVNN